MEGLDQLADPAPKSADIMKVLRNAHVKVNENVRY